MRATQERKPSSVGTPPTKQPFSLGVLALDANVAAAVAGGVAFVFHHFAPLPLLKGTALLPLNRAAAPRLGVCESALTAARRGRVSGGQVFCAARRSVSRVLYHVCGASAQCYLSAGFISCRPLHWGTGPLPANSCTFPKGPGHPRAAPPAERGPWKQDTKQKGRHEGRVLWAIRRLIPGPLRPQRRHACRPRGGTAVRVAGRSPDSNGFLAVREQEHLAPPPFPGELGDRGSHSGGAAAPQITSGVSAHCSPPARATP
ncbi:unnamed protein product [Boreogadus saida]